MKNLYSEGPLACDIAFIGEAPGAAEARTGRPFCGPAGEEFDRLLAGAGIIRSACYITNVVKERPKSNDISLFVDLTKAHKIFTPEYLAYERQLYKELNQTTAKVFVPLGNVSLYALTRLTGITKRRGSILTGIDEIRNRKIIPTIHPAAALRQFMYRYYILHDLRRAKAESNFSEVDIPQRQLTVRPYLWDSLNFLRSILEHSTEISVDIEIFNYEVSCISFAIEPNRGISIPFLYEKGDYVTLPDEVLIWKLIAQILERPDITKVFQNAIFDCGFLFEHYGIRTQNIQDTMIAQGILFPDFPKGLDFITSMLTKEPYYKDEGKMWFKTLGTNFDNFWLYNAKDSAVTLEAWYVLLKELKKRNNYETYLRQLGLVEPLIYMQTRGMYVNSAALLFESKTSAEEIERLIEEFHSLAGEKLNHKSPKQLAKFFYQTRKFPTLYNRKTHKPTTDDIALKRLARRGCKEAAIIQKIRKLEKAKSTYLDMKFDADGRVRGSYNPIGTKTGRLSSSQTIYKTGGNMQNLTPQFKQQVFADPGYMLFYVDLGQAENRIVAWVGPEPTMRQAFIDGVDIHSKTASMLFNIPIDQVSDEPGSSSLVGGTKSQRFWGKQVNHSLNYGLGYRAFALRYEMNEVEGQTLVERYHTVYPGVRGNYHTMVKAQLANGRTVTNCYGRKRKFLDRWGNSLFLDAYAQIPQSTVGDKINKEGLQYIYTNQQLFALVELLNQVHDSIEFQIPIAAGWNEIAHMVQLIVASLETPIPWKDPFVIPADVKAGTCLGKMKEPQELTGVCLQDLYERSLKDD